ncbi:MAG: outer membrane beta-barrel protein [Pseudomonadales bacterium]|nr:outer membrane beta-barrel protein [Pseudomonadales bacterium]
MKTYETTGRGWPVIAMAGAIALSIARTGLAQETPPAPDVEVAMGPIEEVVVIGRYRSAATDIVSERIDSDVAIDFLDAEGIARLGDSNVASALRRVPGVTVRDDKFVYVRGLGERYSSTQLNGAAVPSPDLTRDVLPLDIFPAEIIDALAITKSYSPDLPAAFGGGNVDIRTKRVPEDAVFNIKLNTGWNSEGGDKAWTYNGGGDDSWGEDDGTRALPGALRDALVAYEGNLSPNNILTVLRRGGGNPTIQEADLINRQLATTLNRDLDLKRQSIDPDLNGEITGGYRWFLGEDWEFGFLALGAYESAQRNRNRVNRRVVNPDLNYSLTERSVDQVNWTGALNLGLRFTDDHEIGTFSLALRNTEDETSNVITCLDGQFNDCGDELRPTQGRLYDIRYEQRDLRVNQVTGRHKLGDATLGFLPEMFGFLERVRDLEVTWYYSDSTAKSDIPNEARFGLIETLDPATGGVTSSQLRPTASSGEYRFSELDDDVLSHGFAVSVPQYWGRLDATLSAGHSYSRKGRRYEQYTFGLGSTAPGFPAVAEGTPSEVFSDENLLDLGTGIRIVTGIGGFGTESYLAGQIVDASFFKFDLLWDSTWRLSGGARWESFQQLGVPVNLLAFRGSRVPLSPQEIADSAINEDDWYPALALTYIRPGFWSDEFQLRLGWSQTVARPDLREISRSTYIDPLTEARVRGNPFLVPSELTNIDVRGEWFWDNGDNFTVSLFLKDIVDPIETVQGGATEENILFNFVNADSAEIYGVEFEGLKGLDFASRWLGDWVNGFYVAGNLTLSDTEIEITPGPGVGNITNQQRRLTQHSKWVANLQLGYDSPGGNHGATLAYNSFGERILFAGIDGFGDAFEQPFHSLDFTYSWFATDQLTLKFRLRNLLKDKLEVEQDGVSVIEQKVGLTGLVDLRWAL